MKEMKTLPIAKAESRIPKVDPHFAAAAARVKLATRDLMERGIIDSDGRRIRHDLPADMREGSERDFGG